MTIASATKNPLQVYIMKNVWEFLHVGIRENLLHLYAQPANIEKIHQQHTDIYLSIRSGDADAALQAMKHHIEFVIHFFRNQDPV